MLELKVQLCLDQNDQFGVLTDKENKVAPHLVGGGSTIHRHPPKNEIPRPLTHDLFLWCDALI